MPFCTSFSFIFRVSGISRYTPFNLLHAFLRSPVYQGYRPWVKDLSRRATTRRNWQRRRDSRAIAHQEEYYKMEFSNFHPAMKYNSSKLLRFAVPTISHLRTSVFQISVKVDSYVPSVFLFTRCGRERRSFV